MPRAPAFIRGSGNSFPRRPKRRLAWVVTVWASMVGWTPGSATEVRQPAADRIATGLVELLRDKRDVAYPALQAIAAKRGDTLDSDDRFWPDLARRVLDREDGSVVAILELRKQVRPVTVRLPGNASTTEYRFRHERILDFYTHFALLGDDPTERFALVRERPFEGVFEYLARELPPDDAAELKEYLLSDALDRNDHRLSDRFLQHLRWRSLLDRQDPSWIVDFDLPAARDALAGFGALSVEREVLETEMRARRAVVDEARRVTRVLSAPDAGALETAVLAMFERVGGKVEPTEGGAPPLVVAPGNLRFTLVCLAGEKIVGTLARIGVQARLERSTGPKLLVLNPQPDLDPRERDWESLTIWDELVIPGLVVATSRRLRDIFGRAEGTADKIPFWGELLGKEAIEDHASTLEHPAA